MIAPSTPETAMAARARAVIGDAGAAEELDVDFLKAPKRVTGGLSCPGQTPGFKACRLHRLTRSA
jgi:hypothetical protein